jgi:hypothetical protein
MNVPDWLWVFAGAAGVCVGFLLAEWWLFTGEVKGQAMTSAGKVTKLDLLRIATKMGILCNGKETVRVLLDNIETTAGLLVEETSAARKASHPKPGVKTARELSHG